MRIFSLYLYAMRRRRPRKIVKPPLFTGYRPYGQSHRVVEDIELLYEEYEAIKLADYDLLTHLEASDMMGVSRATFARIYESARRKIAQILVEGKGLKAVFGNVDMGKDWYLCHDCSARFSEPIDRSKLTCAICKSENIESLKTV